jgi:hypothetical protein
LLLLLLLQLPLLQCLLRAQLLLPLLVEVPCLLAKPLQIFPQQPLLLLLLLLLLLCNWRSVVLPPLRA